MKTITCNHKISFKKGCTVVAHDDIISSLNDKDFRIFHRKYSNLRFTALKSLKERGSRDINQEMADAIVNSDFAFYSDKNDNDWELLKLERPQILHALVILTNKCNMHCKYCYTEANKHLGERELTGIEWINLFNTIKIPSRYMVQNISFTGGEPTLHPNFIEILDAISGEYKIEISSNGLEISDELIDTLFHYEGLNFFNVSIDSCNKEEDEIMRGTGTYQKRFENIEKIYENDIPLCFGVVASHININSLKETTEYFLEKFPGTSIKYIPITKIGDSLNIDDPIFLTENDVKIYLDTLLEMKEKYKEKVLTDPSSFHGKETGDSHWSGRCSNMKFESERTLNIDNLSEENKISTSEKCNAAYGVVAISPSGRIRPCLRPDSFYSDILEYVPKDILMPHIDGLTRNDIENLSFWKIVKQEASNFNPLETCALKYAINKGGEKNEY